MRLPPTSLAMTLAIALGAATACAPAAGPVASAPPIPTQTQATPAGVATPSAAPTPAATLAGEARYFGARLADAEVLVATPGQAPAPAGRTDAAGRFAIAAPAGGLALVVVRAGDRRAAALLAPPARSLSAVGDPVVVDELGAFVYLVFLPRLAAIEGLAAAPPEDPAIRAAGLAIVEAAIAALRGLDVHLDRDAFEAASATIDAGVRVPDAATRGKLVAACPAAYLPAMQACGDGLAALVRTQVLDRGRPMPAADLLGPIPLTVGGAAAPIFAEPPDEEPGGGGSSGGGGDEGTEARGSMGFEPATEPFANETAEPSITF